MSAKIKFSVIGCGLRSTHLVKLLIKNKQLQLTGAYDPNKKKVAELFEKNNIENGIVYDSYQELTANKDIDWVIIGSPNSFHTEHAQSAFANNKNVFIEKPLSTTIEGCLAINAAHKMAGTALATGFVLRYSPLYKKVKELLMSGELGKIISVDANENLSPSHGAYIMSNWRNQRALAGSHILEKCVHDLDLLNWFIGSVPAKIAAFHGNDMWIKENDNIFEKKYYDEWAVDDGDVCDPFNNEKDIEDNVVTIMQYYNNTRVQFQATRCNAIPERRMFFSCTKGTLMVELFSATIRYKTVSDPVEKTLTFKSNFHGGGDRIIMQELADSMVNNTKPKCSGTEGLLSAVVGIKIDEAAKSGQVLSLDKIWKEVGYKN